MLTNSRISIFQVTLVLNIPQENLFFLIYSSFLKNIYIFLKSCAATHKCGFKYFFPWKLCELELNTPASYWAHCPSTKEHNSSQNIPFCALFKKNCVRQATDCYFTIHCDPHKFKEVFRVWNRSAQYLMKLILLSSVKFNYVLRKFCHKIYYSKRASHANY